MDYTIKRISDKLGLKAVLEMCWDILGQPNTEIYSEKAWQSRLDNGCLLLYAVNGKSVAAALARAESSESVGDQAVVGTAVKGIVAVFRGPIGQIYWRHTAAFE